MPILDRITLYPIKSLDGVVVDEACVLPDAGLEHDRRWQLTDMEGRVVNGKRTPLLHAIRARYQLDGLCRDAEGTVLQDSTNTVELAVDRTAIAAAAIPGIERLAGLGSEAFPLVPGADGPCPWLSEALGQTVLLVERRGGGFPDDRDASGPTLIATATLMEVATWFGLDLDECRRRFRVNLEIGGCDSFWEDTLASPTRQELVQSAESPHADLPADPYAALPPPEPQEIRVGGARLKATNVCRRCVVPTRDSRTGLVTEHFRDAFEARRCRSIRSDVDAAAWNHWYRLAINTVVLHGGVVRLGESLPSSPVFRPTAR
jgi:uncharacterized protein YcbX